MTERSAPYRLVELFSGIGAQRMGFALAGVPCTAVAMCEVDRWAIASYEAIWGPTPNLGDITKVGRLPECDVLTYSFPCTSVTNCAAANPNRPEGMAEGSGTASSLLWEVKRLLTVARDEGALPAWLVMENVPQVHKGENARHFERWIAFLRTLGYSSQWADLDAYDFGVPQERRRCFMVSRLGHSCPLLPAPPKGVRRRAVRDVMEHGVDERYFLTDRELVGLPRPAGRPYRFVAGGGRTLVDLDWDLRLGARCLGTLEGYYRFEMSNRVYSERGPAPTLTRCVGGGQSTKILDEQEWRIRKLTPLEAWRCQGFPDEAFAKARAVCSDTQLYHQAGNTLCPAVFAEIAKVIDVWEKGQVHVRRGIEDW